MGTLETAVEAIVRGVLMCYFPINYLRIKEQSDPIVDDVMCAELRLFGVREVALKHMWCLIRQVPLFIEH